MDITESVCKCGEGVTVCLWCGWTVGAGSEAVRRVRWSSLDRPAHWSATPSTLTRVVMFPPAIGTLPAGTHQGEGLK